MTTQAEKIGVENNIAKLDIYRPGRSLGREAWERLTRNRASVVGMIIIVFFLFTAIFAPLIAPMSPLLINNGKGYLPPPFYKGTTIKVADPEFVFGTDSLGRDVLSRTIYGARVSMIVGFVPAIIIILMGAAVGMFAGYTGGRADNLLMRLTDVVYAFPDLLFFIIVLVSLRDAPVGRLMNGLFLLFIA